MKRSLLFLSVFLVPILITYGQVIPYLQMPTSESIIVNWRSTAGTESKVYYGEDKASLSQIVTGTVALFSAAKDNNYAYVYHTVSLKGLNANTVYYYQTENNNNRSDIFSFKTQPALGDRGIYRFIILGDHQLEDDRYERLMKAAKSTAEKKYGTPIQNYINLITNVGDQVNEGTLKQYDLVHFKRSETLSANLPIATIVGNHETNGENNPLGWYEKHYYNDYEYKGIKSNSAFYYAMQQGRVLFLMLSSEHAGSTQKKWAESVIAAAKIDADVDWIISYNHRPIQAEQYIGDISTWVRDEIMPLLNTTEKSVMNVGGHHHLYHRGQLRDYPTYHIISGGAAWDQRWGQSTEKDFDDVQKTIDYWPFQIVELNAENRSMSVETYVIGNQVETLSQVLLVDSFSRTFGKSKPNKPSLVAMPDEAIELPYTFESSAYATTTDYAYNSVQFQVASDENLTKLEFDLIRDYENIFGAHPKGAVLVDLHKDVDIFKQTLTKDKLLNGTHYIRVRHRDRNLEWSEWSDQLMFVTKGGADNLPSLVSNKSSYLSNEDVEITYNHTLNQSGQWIGLYFQGKIPSSTSNSVKWSNASGVSGSQVFKLDQSGVYYAAIFLDGGYTIQAKTDLFYVGKVPVLEAEKTVFIPDEPITFSFSNAPALAKDWIGLYKEGQTLGPDADKSARWQYVTTSSGNVSFDALPVGDYFITYCLKDGYYEPGERLYIQVIPKNTGTGISEIEGEVKVNISSNWENRQIHINYPTHRCESLKLYNVNGLVVKSLDFTDSTIVFTNDLSAGVYILRIGSKIAKVLLG